MKMYVDGIKVKDLIEYLKKQNQDKYVIISSDEEQNQLFKGVYIENYDDSIIIAGLSGCEYED